MSSADVHHPESGPAMGKEEPITLIVPDMSCGHCAAVITKAVENGAPGAKVTVDLVTKRVVVEGGADRKRVEDLVRGAGYTPSRP